NAANAAGAAVGVAVGALLLLRGLGLWALAWAVVARAAVVIVGDLVFAARLGRDGFRFRLRASRPVWREAMGLLPATASANLAFLIGNNTDILLVTTLLRPDLATVYALTRKAVDTLRSLLDTLVYGVHRGLAQLVASAADRLRSRRVLTELQRLRLGTSCLAAACYVAL